MPLLGTSGTASSRAFNLYGIKSRVTVPLTISSNTYNYDVYTNRGPTYVAGISDIVLTVAAPATVGSTSTGTYALLVPSSFSPLDTVTIVNNGVIQGMGGAAGNGATASVPGGVQGAGGPGSAGGNAIYVNRPTIITNNGTVASGGGGGGGGGSAIFGPTAKNNSASGGGGGGGGAGFNGGALGSGGPATAPTVRAPGSPGGAGTSPAGGSPGAGGVAGPTTRGGNGGAGGGRGAAGSGGAGGVQPGGTGASSSGGAAGNYIVGNPFVTWPVTGTRQGNVA